MSKAAIVLWTVLILSPMIHAQSDTIPFSRIDLLDDYEPWMDTLKTPRETIELHVYAEQCLDVNGELVEYLDRSDDAAIAVGSVIDLIPGDSTTVYYWASAVPHAGSTGGGVLANLELPVNASSKSIEFSSAGETDEKEGILTFINGKVDYDLVLIRLSGPEHEYRFRLSFDTHAITDTGNVTSNGRMDKNLPDPGIRFYPNPVRDQAYFETGKELRAYEIFDMNGRRTHLEGCPEKKDEGLYSMDLGLFEPGIHIIRFLNTDRTLNTLRIMVK